MRIESSWSWAVYDNLLSTFQSNKIHLLDLELLLDDYLKSHDTMIIDQMLLSIKRMSNWIESIYESAEVVEVVYDDLKSSFIPKLYNSRSFNWKFESDKDEEYIALFLDYYEKSSYIIYIPILSNIRDKHSLLRNRFGLFYIKDPLTRKIVFSSYSPYDIFDFFFLKTESDISKETTPSTYLRVVTAKLENYASLKKLNTRVNKFLAKDKNWE